MAPTSSLAVILTLRVVKNFEVCRPLWVKLKTVTQSLPVYNTSLSVDVLAQIFLSAEMQESRANAQTRKRNEKEPYLFRVNLPKKKSGPNCRFPKLALYLRTAKDNLLILKLFGQSLSSIVFH